MTWTSAEAAWFFEEYSRPDETTGRPRPSLDDYDEGRGPFCVDMRDLLPAKTDLEELEW